MKRDRIAQKEKEGQRMMVRVRARVRETDGGC
jgi:hypothetical protein